MTLLTLEEIEKYERYRDSTDTITVSHANLVRMLATARAYWELQEPAEAPAKTVSYRGLGSDEYDQHQRELKEAFEKGRAMAERELKDKPHAPTIRAIVEALEAGREFINFGDGREEIVFNSYEAIKSLEKHLE